jgi:serine/threonine protein kinase
MHAGSRLTDLIAAGPVPADRLLAVGTALAEAVEAAHAQGVALGGLAPATVFVPDAGGARPLDAAWIPISARREDDLLALGALLYAMATGVAPYGVARPEAAPPSPIEHNPRLPSGLVQLIRRAVHPDATERFAAARELHEALREIRRAPGSLESLLPAEHVSSSAAVKPPPRPAPGEEDDLYDADLFDDPDDDAAAAAETEPERGLPPR